MGIFYATIISTYILGFLARIAKEKNYKILAMLWIFLIILILVLVSGFRYGIGDTGYYKLSYEQLAKNPSKIEFKGDFGFGLMSLFLTKFSTNPQILIFIVALITNILNIFIINQYCSYLELGVYLYITSGYYFVTMNGIRQCLAAALIFGCTKMLIRGNFIKYFIFIILISTFHGSALIMIPLYFVVRQEAWSKKMILFIIMTSIFIIFYTYLEPLFMNILQYTSYGHYSEYYIGGSSIIRTIVNLVPVILAYIKREKLKEVFPESNIFVNICIINSVFVSLGMFNWIFNRLTIYFLLYNIILIPVIVRKCFNSKEKRILYFGIIFCYFIFMYREQVIGMNTQYKSDYLNIKNIFYLK